MLFEPGRIPILNPSNYILSLQMLFEPAPGRISILNPSIYIPSSEMLFEPTPELKTLEWNILNPDR